MEISRKVSKVIIARKQSESDKDSEDEIKSISSGSDYNLNQKETEEMQIKTNSEDIDTNIRSFKNSKCVKSNNAGKYEKQLKSE